MSKFLTILIAAKEDLASNGVQVRSYSGRGMYGSECIAIDGDEAECQAALSALISEQISQVSDGDTTRDDAREFVTLLMEYKTDNMGKGIVMYWPGIEYKDDEEG